MRAVFEDEVQTLRHEKGLQSVQFREKVALPQRLRDPLLVLLLETRDSDYLFIHENHAASGYCGQRSELQDIRFEE